MPHSEPLRWRKARKSGGNGGNCVEVAHTVDRIRDSKNPAAELKVSRSALLEFMAGVKADQVLR